MSTPSARIEDLINLNRSHGIIALRKALEHAQHDNIERRRLIDALLVHGESSACADAIGALDAGDDLSDRPVVDVEKLTTTWQVLRRRNDAHGRANLIALLTHQAGVAGIELVCSMLIDRACTRREQTLLAQLMLDLVRDQLGVHGVEWKADDATRALIDRAVTRACDAFDVHRQNEVLASAILALRARGTEIRAWVDAPARNEDAGGLALRRFLSTPVHEVSLACLIDLLTDRTLGPLAARALTRIRSAREYEIVLARAHLLVHPARRRVLRMLNRPASCVPSDVIIASLSRGACLGLVKLIEALPLRGASRRRILMRASNWPDPMARRMALRLLGRYDGRLGFEAYQAFDEDENRWIACVAKSLQEACRGATPASIEAFRAGWRTMHDDERAVRARAVLGHDRAGFARFVQEVAQSRDDEARGNMGRLLRRLQQPGAINRPRGQGRALGDAPDAMVVRGSIDQWSHTLRNGPGQVSASKREGSAA